MPQRVVIIGAGMGGLSAAIHARLLGHEVTVIEGREVSGGKAAEIKQDGFRLDPGPSIIIMPEIYRRVFRLAGRNPDDYLQFDRLDPITRVFFEGESAFDLPADRAECLRAVAQLYRSDARSLESLLTRFDKVIHLVDQTVFAKPIEKWSDFASPGFIRLGLAMRLSGNYRKQIDRWFQSPLLRAFFYGFPSYSGQGLDGSGASALFIPYYMLTQGVFFPRGGVAAIPKAFTQLAEELGVKFVYGDRVTQVDGEGESLRAVTTASGERFEADRFISNLDRFTFGQLLHRPTNATPSFSYFTMHLGLPRRFPNFSHHTLFIPKDFVEGFEDLYARRVFPRSPIVYVNDTTELDPAGAPPGHTNFFAVVTCPAEESHLDWRTVASEAKSACLATFTRFGVDVSDPVFERVQTPTTFRERDGSYRGSLYGLDESSRPFKGMMPFPNQDPQYRNLRYCGGSVQPGAGLPMVTLSGMFAARD